MCPSAAEAGPVYNHLCTGLKPVPFKTLTFLNGTAFRPYLPVASYTGNQSFEWPIQAVLGLSGLLMLLNPFPLSG